MHNIYPLCVWSSDSRQVQFIWNNYPLRHSHKYFVCKAINKSLILNVSSAHDPIDLFGAYLVGIDQNLEFTPGTYYQPRTWIVNLKAASKNIMTQDFLFLTVSHFAYCSTIHWKISSGSKIVWIHTMEVHAYRPRTYLPTYFSPLVVLFRFDAERSALMVSNMTAQLAPSSLAPALNFFKQQCSH